MMTDTIATARFTGQRLRPTDLPDFTRLHHDQGVRRTLSAAHDPASDERIGNNFAQLLEHWEREGFGTWVWRARRDDRFVAMAGLQHHAGLIEITYAALSTEWGQGFATEIGTALLDTAFGPLGLPEVVCYILPTNNASRQIMQKLGFVYDSARLHAGLPHIFYRLQKATWSQIHPASIERERGDSLPDLYK